MKILEFRQVVVTRKGEYSFIVERSCPQGGILSSLLWSININDLIVLSIPNVKIEAYADDVCTIITSSKIATLESLSSREFLYFQICDKNTQNLLKSLGIVVDTNLYYITKSSILLDEHLPKLRGRFEVACEIAEDFVDFCPFSSLSQRNCEKIEKRRLERKKHLNQVFADISDLSVAIDNKFKEEEVPADYPLHKMLRCCDILLPTLPAPPPRDPQLEARCLRLRKEQEQKEYDAMVNRIAPPKERKPDNLAAELREVNRQLIQVFQFVLSTGSAFVFGFWGVDWAAGPFDFGSRSLIGVFCALVVAIAEIYFLIKIIGVSDNFIDGVKNKKICSKDE
ncbi:hypothetical protein QYM36_000573 [Artemia franciscana]|uniref:Reverse transcriptase domain-containing protein n=1 Tax=Artemia franciscana TaxID=6661 RepID=A0AA88LGN3_ARTSF|nr:hypothetical protein QYM36_000573 [Artemia franciscana]